MAYFHVIAGADEAPARPIVNKITTQDLGAALAEGVKDFMSMPTHLVFLCVFYPLAGFCLAAFVSSVNALYLLYPLISGFALIGPFAAIGLYEMSRRREAGLDASWIHAFDVLKSPAIPSILAVGLLLAFIFVGWLASAQALYQALFGPEAPASYAALFAQTFGTSQGWLLIVLGNAIGLVFAIVALSVTVVSFPLMLDRDVGAAVAVETSVRAVWKNPAPMAMWGLIVAVSLAIGLGLAFIGLVIVIPVLGHATWRLYRRVIAAR